ncbi:MAG: ABC transporter ATP-binding protein [Thermoplasmata archaeon]|nr:ABC transporter ATP-binding protein [Thermoplasmata archaeon]
MVVESKYKSATAYQLSALRRYPGLTVFAVSLALFASLLTVLSSWVLGDAMDELQYAVDNSLGMTPEFVTACWIIFGLALLLFATYVVVGFAFAIMTLRWERDARQEFFETIQGNSMTFHDQVDSKKMLAVAMQDIRWVRFSLNPALRNIIMAVGSLIFASIMLTWIDIEEGVFPVLGVIVAIGSPLYLFFAYRYAVAIEPVRRARSEQNEKLTAVSQEVFRGIEVVRAFGAEELESSKFKGVSKEYEKLLTKEGRLAAFYIPNLILTATTAAAFLYAANQVMLGIFPIGTLVKAIALLAVVDGFSHMLPRFLLVIRGGHVNAQRIVDILDWADPLQEPEKPVKDIDWTGDIVLENVSFKYASGEGNEVPHALKGLSLKIPGGSRVALIGGPGSGKSTILKLLLRLYDPTGGKISIGGTDLSKVRTKDARAAVGLVEQNIFLFRRSVKDNIAFGKKDATRDDVVTAATRAQASEFIEELAEGYDTVIGERGMTLSGGQRQRLAIARTLLQDPKILLLDDSVSAIDARTEFQLRKALDEVMKGRTSITVTQRLRTLMEADMVIIMEKGMVVAVGDHEELIKTSEHYKRIFRRLPGAERYFNQGIGRDV